MKKTQLLGMVLLAAAMPNAASADEPALYAYQANPFGSSPYGLYKMGINGMDCAMLWNDPLAKDKKLDMLTGWIRDGRLCGTIGVYSGFDLGDTDNNFYVERDLLTGEVLKKTPINVTSDNFTNFFVAADYCPYDNFIYGVGKNTNGRGYVFKKSPADNLNETVVVNTDYGLQTGLCFNKDWGMLVTVVLNKVNELEFTAELDEVDINTGKRTKLFDLNPDIILDYKGIFALTWVSSRQKYYWNAWCTQQPYSPVNENESKLIEIDPFTGECTTLADFSYDFNVNYFVLPDDKPYADPAAPAAPTGLDYTDNDGAVAVTFTLPDTRNDGSPLEGEISYSVFQGSRLLLSGKGMAGSPVTTDAVTFEEGTYFLRVRAEDGSIGGSSAIATVFIGKDIPFSPTNVILNETTLTWNPVTFGQHGSELSDVTYQVSINGNVVGTTADTSFDVAPFINQEQTLTLYTAEVKAVAGGVYSSAAVSNSLIAGRPWIAPFEVTPDAHDFGLCTLQDIDGDGTNWSLYERSYDNEPVFLSGFNSAMASEDWIFFPAFTGSSTSVYTLSFDVALAQEDLVNGELQAWIGTSPEKAGMKRCLIPATRISRFNPTNYYADFVIDGDLAGAPELYIGLAASSREKENSPLMVNSVKVSEKAADLNRPSAVTDFKAAVSENDPEIATVSFRFPETLLNGTKIPAGTPLTARIDVLGMQHTDVVGTPGQAMTADVKGFSGYNVIVVTPKMGDEAGLGSDVSCHLGFGRPGHVRNLRITYDEDDLGMTINWDAPDTDYYGQPASGGRFSYKVWQLNSQNQYELAVEVPSGLSHADVRMSENLDLVNIHVAVTAVNNEGEGPLTSTVAQIGEPYTMPLYEDFNGDDYTYKPFTIFNGKQYDRVEYNWGSPSKLGLPQRFHVEGVGDLFCAWPIPGKEDPISKIWIPKFSTTGYENVKLILNLWTGADAPETTVTGWAYGMEAPVALGVLPRDKDGYNPVTIPLPENMCNNSWVQISLDSSYPTEESRLLLVSYAVNSEGGVNGVSDTILGTVTGGDNLIFFAGFNGETAHIYAPDGRKVNSVKVESDRFSLNIAGGLYVVQVGKQTSKVVVR